MERPSRQFLFTLALRMGRTVAELLRTISAKELAEWRAFNRLQPIGDDRGDLQAGIVASCVFNAKRSKKTDKIFKPADFMMYLDTGVKSKEVSKQIRQVMSKFKRAN